MTDRQGAALAAEISKAIRDVFGGPSNDLEKIAWRLSPSVDDSIVDCLRDIAGAIRGLTDELRTHGADPKERA